MGVPVKIRKTVSQAVLPSYASAECAGADLYACTSSATVIPAGATVLIPTGISLEIPEGFAGLIYARSGIALKRGLAPANKVGVIDSDYRGEVMVSLHNHSEKEAVVEAGERIAQLIITPFLRADFTESEALSGTARGEGGFGSTGTK